MGLLTLVFKVLFSYLVFTNPYGLYVYLFIYLLLELTTADTVVPTTYNTMFDTNVLNTILHNTSFACIIIYATLAGVSSAIQIH